MTPFEQGYAAFLGGKTLEDNPYDKDKCPYSFKRWGCGWLRAQAEKRRKS